jgi:GH35 family endo-1,4-beta-xylanase
MNRRTFLKTTAASAFLLGPIARGAEPSPAKPTDAEILAQCQARIERHRKSDGVLVLRDSRGRPVSRATVKIEQTRHEFLFGCNFFMFERKDDAAREEAYRAQFTALLNYCTLGFYWAAYEREQGRPDYDYTDRVVEFCAQQGLRCKGHPLVWDHPVSSPPWLPDDLQEIARLSHARVREIVTRFKGRIDLWDVVNEAAHLADKANKTKMGEFGASVGAVPYVAEHLKTARAANPQATLLVNDYRTGPKFFQIIEGLRQSGRLPCDAIGIQSHMHNGLWPLHRVWDICDTYAPFGVPLHFTETTLVSGLRLGPGENWGATTPEGEAKQAEDTIKFYTTLFAHPAVEALTWWDFSDHGCWQGAPGGWLRKDETPKPVYARLHSLLRSEWWTRIQARPNVLGRVPLRAFHGTHRVTITLPSGFEVVRDIHIKRGQPNRFELTVA